MLRPTWAEIDLSKFRQNINKIRQKVALSTKILAVIKADGYGHGALPLAKAAEEEKISFLGAATVEEGIELRQGGVSLPILLMGSVYPFSNFSEIIRHRLTPTIASWFALEKLLDYAAGVTDKVCLHLKIDTGMGRIGVSPEQALPLIKKIVHHQSIFLEGIYTHLACADTDPGYTAKQLDKFFLLKKSLEKEGIRIPYWHASNSAAILNFPQSHLDLVRSGLALYGLNPRPSTEGGESFQPILSWKTQVVFFKKILAGSAISYGRTFVAQKDSWIATLPVGYADGYSRRLSNLGEALIHNQRLRVAGTVTMDMIMIDVTPIKDQIKIGDEAVLLGKQGKEKITAEELADKIGAIPYEIVCAISKRVPRVYV
ncbi:MAG: alanine racemase [Elusimicrobiota bacterium]